MEGWPLYGLSMLSFHPGERSGSWEIQHLCWHSWSIWVRGDTDSVNARPCTVYDQHVCLVRESTRLIDAADSPPLCMMNSTVVWRVGVGGRQILLWRGLSWPCHVQWRILFAVTMTIAAATSLNRLFHCRTVIAIAVHLSKSNRLYVRKRLI